MVDSQTRQPYSDYAATQQVPPRWFLGTLTWIKASGEQTEGRLSLVEHVVPAGSESPWHVHHTEDESFYVIEGRITVIVADKRVALGRGGYAFGPRGVPHGFRVEGHEPARILLLTNGGQLAAFVQEMSDPAPAAILPEPREPDIPRLLALATAHEMAVLGPLPQ